jgi:hypothetical protein
VTAGSSCVTAVCLVEVGNASKLVERRDGMCEVGGARSQRSQYRGVTYYVTARARPTGPVPLRYRARDYSPRCTQTSSDLAAFTLPLTSRTCVKPHTQPTTRLGAGSRSIYTLCSPQCKKPLRTRVHTLYFLIRYLQGTTHVNVAVIGQRSTLAIILKHLYRKCSTTKVSGSVEQKDDGTA